MWRREGVKVRVSFRDRARYRLWVRNRVLVRVRIGIRVRVRVSVTVFIKPIPLSRKHLACKGILLGVQPWRRV